MVIELRGVEFHNKGAELMLKAILHKIRTEMPDTIFVMERNYFAPKPKLLENKIFQKINKKRSREKYISYLPKFFRKRLHYIDPSEIEVVLEGSGFAYGDQWGAERAGLILADDIQRWKVEGKKVILLPQALGPFTKTDLIEKMKIISVNADLIFARDEISYKYIREISPTSNNIRLMPDFTNLIAGSVPSYFDKTKYEVAIIPNNKMLEAKSEKEGQQYVLLLQKFVEKIQRLGLKPYFLIHEGKKDLQLAEITNQKIQNKIPVLKEDNALYVKGIIGASKAVVTSRFHGLVSSLCQAVPCLATGWSHKYEMLLHDYNYSEALIGIDCSDAELEEKLLMITQGTSRKNISEHLKKEAGKQKQLSDEMWKMVFSKMQEGYQNN